MGIDIEWRYEEAENRNTEKIKLAISAMKKIIPSKYISVKEWTQEDGTLLAIIFVLVHNFHVNIISLTSAVLKHSIVFVHHPLNLDWR